MPGMTDRDHFAAAALTGLLYPEVDDEFAMPYIVGRAYLWADAMLRERCRGGGDCPGSDNAPNLDAAPAARAGTPGTGDTPTPISGCVFDRPKPITGPDPYSRVWETHTPATHATHGEGSVPREDTQEPVAWGVANGKGLLATSISRIDAVDMQSDYACDTEVVPLYLHPPVTEPMPKEKRAEISAEPAAWYVRNRAAGPPMLFWDEERAKKAAFACGVGARPLYLWQDFSQKNWTLTDAEREAIDTAAHAAVQLYPLTGVGLAAVLRGLLERLGGEK